MSRTFFRPNSLFSNETIASQSDDFGKKLETLMGLIHSEISSKESIEKISERHPVVEAIEKLIFSRIKMKVSIITDEAPAAIMPFYSNRNHIFLPDFFRGNISLRDQVKLLKKSEGKTGTVNLQNATLSGLFSEYEHSLYLNFNTLIKEFNMTPGEMAGVTMHEIGHGFDACYYSDRAERTNQILANVARVLAGGEKGDIEYIYRELKEVKPSITKEEVDKIVNGGRVVAGLTWFRTFIGIVRSQMLDDTYNKTSFESGADSFASRFGYGKELMLALDKISVGYPEKSAGIRSMIYLLNASALLGLGLLIMFSLGAGALAAALVFSCYSLLVLVLSREDVGDYTYDKLKHRYLRIRADAIDQLKSKSLKKDTVRSLLDGIYEMDAVIKETSVVNVPSSAIANILFSGAREAVNSIDDQQLMEALSSNDLFIHAAEFGLKS